MQLDLCTFAFDLYARDGVESACLRAQDEGINVCFLLCAAWLDQQKRPWQAELEEQLRCISEHFEQAMIAPLRQLRIRWKPLAEQDAEWGLIRQQIKSAELEAEKLLLQRLQQCCEDFRDLNHANLEWLAALKLSPSLRAALSISRD